MDIYIYTQGEEKLFLKMYANICLRKFKLRNDIYLRNINKAKEKTLFSKI